jgi:hypothetical protein
MKRDELNKKVTEELDHIPRGLRGSTQNEFRMRYNVIRRRDLGRNPASLAKDSLLKAIETARNDEPGFMPSYDRKFFGT